MACTFGNPSWLAGYHLTSMRLHASPVCLDRSPKPKTDVRYDWGTRRKIGCHPSYPSRKHIAMDPEVVVGIDFGMTVSSSSSHSTVDH
jgi:hypothetical protein